MSYCLQKLPRLETSPSTTRALTKSTGYVTDLHTDATSCHTMGTASNSNISHNTHTHKSKKHHLLTTP